MTIRTTKHATFTIERVYPATPARVFAAWSSKEAKTAWAYCHAEWPTTGTFSTSASAARSIRRDRSQLGGTRHIVDSHYFDIVPDQRIVYAYDMHLDDRHISVSLATIEFFAVVGGTRMVLTEQGAFLDGYDDIAGREEGTRIGLGNLDRLFGQQRAA